MEFVKVVIDLKNSLISDIQARVISKPEILRRNGGGGGGGGGRELSSQNGSLTFKMGELELMK